MTDDSKRRQALDPAVADILGDLEGRRGRDYQPPSEAPQTVEDKPRALTPKQAKERVKIRKRGPYRATYDLPPGLKEDIARVAKELGTTASQVAAIMLTEGLRRHEEGDIAFLMKGRRESESPRYDWNLRTKKKGR